MPVAIVWFTSKKPTPETRLPSMVNQRRLTAAPGGTPAPDAVTGVCGGPSLGVRVRVAAAFAGEGTASKASREARATASARPAEFLSPLVLSRRFTGCSASLIFISIPPLSLPIPPRSPPWLRPWGAPPRPHGAQRRRPPRPPPREAARRLPRRPSDRDPQAWVAGAEEGAPGKPPTSSNPSPPS